MIFKRIMSLVMCLACLASSLEAGILDQTLFSKPKGPEAKTIKVLIAHDKPSVLLEIKGKYKLYDPNLKRHVSTRFIGKCKSIEALNEGLQWGEEFPGVYQLQFVPDSPATTLLVEGVEYKGTLYVYNVEGSVSVVNEVEIEEYIRSSLAHQFKDPLPAETLAAIAIVARTNALYLAENPVSTFFSVDGEKIGYEGFDAPRPTNALAKAIAATKNMVMSLDAKSLNPFPASWSAEGTPSKISVSDAEQLERTGEHAAQILNKAFPGNNLRYIQGS